jgi:hypothetical protein
MDRRKSIKALLVGTASAAVLVESCKTEDKKTTDTTKATVLNEDDRMVEEKEANKKLREATFFTPRRNGHRLQVLADIIIPKDEVSGSASEAKVPGLYRVYCKRYAGPPNTLCVVVYAGSIYNRLNGLKNHLQPSPTSSVLKL